jgi:teichuronic acid biosynthesis glycosyltransferase TuaC
LRLAVVTSQFPIAADPTRGRPIIQTLEALAKRTTLEVFVPHACYPAWLAPRSYRYVEPPEGEERLNGLVVHHVRYSTLPLVGRLLNGHRVGRALRAPLREFRPTLVLSYWLYPDAFGAAAVAGELCVPLVSGARGSDIRARDAASLALTRSALARSTRVLTVSEDLRQIAVERFGVRADRITTVPNGCNTAIFRPAERAAVRARLGVPGAARLVMFAGRVVPAKGVRELLTAWLDLARHDSNLHLAVVGDGPVRAELQARCAAADLAGRAHFPGALPAGQVAEWMQACDVFCLPSHTEGHPNVLVEALACGRPVVATPVGGILEIVDKHNGLLTPVGDAVLLAEALRSALSRGWDETVLSARFGRSWDEVAAETLAVCEAALRDGPVNRRASDRDRSARTTP